jgi:predicted RNase H-like nuclease (RuvC/YqgF family)
VSFEETCVNSETRGGRLAFSMCNSHHAPRARKHVKALLKQNSELEKQLSQQDDNLSKIESLIARLSDADSRKKFADSSSAKKLQPSGSNDELRRLQDAIKREKMEILAIEQTTEDLLERVRDKDV